MELLEAVIWTMSVLCSCKVSFAIVKGMVSPLCNLLLNHFYELPLDVLIYAVETLMLLSDGPNEQIQVVMDTGITPVLVRLLKGDLPSSEEKSWPLIIRVIRCLGNFTSGTIAQTQIVITAGALAHVGAIIVNGTVSVKNVKVGFPLIITHVDVFECLPSATSPKGSVLVSLKHCSRHSQSDLRTAKGQEHSSTIGIKGISE